MRYMDRYVIREMMLPFLAGSLLIALLFDANQLIYILKTFSLQNLPPIAMAQMLIYRTPYWLNFTLPAGVALAASLAITRMTRESELVAMRACGVAVVRVVLPVALFGLVVGGFNYYLVEKVIPKTERRAKRLEIEAGISAATPVFNSNVWITLQNRRVTLGTVQRVSDDTLKVTDIVLGERPNKDEVQFTFAESAVYRAGVWTLKDAQIYILNSKGPELRRAIGEEAIINQPIFIDDLFEQAQPQDRTAAELMAAIKAGKQVGRDMTADEIAYHQRFSTPAACLVFAFVAPIFSIIFARSGSFMGLVLSFVMVLLHFNAKVVAEIFGANHWVSPVLAAWLPNLCFLALGLLAVRRLE